MMPYCANCGAPVSERYCGTCGAKTDAPGESTPGPDIPRPTPTAGPQELSDNIAGALCYLVGPVTGILFLVLEPYNRKPTIRFHAWQSTLLFGGVMAIDFVFPIFGLLLPRIIATPLGFLLWIVNLL